MHGATIGLVVLLVAVALAVVVVVLWLSRTMTLTRRVGSFPCLLAEREGGPWRAGVAEYGRARMAWWRRASLAPWAAAMWRRQGLVVLERHALPVDRAPGQRAIAVVVRCRVTGASGSGASAGSSEVWLQMGPGAYAGFAGWIEATPTASVGSVI